MKKTLWVWGGGAVLFSLIAQGCGTGLTATDPAPTASSGSGTGGGSGGGTTNPYPDYQIFLTNSTYAATFVGGVSGADTKCVSDANRPSGSTATFKAFIVDGTNRVACTTANCGGGPGEHVNWVLQPNTAYYRGTKLISTTDANGLFTFPFSEALGTAQYMWTGLDNTWVTDANLCTSWSGFAGNGAGGSLTATDINAVAGTNAIFCWAAMRILCVQQ
jgi:hypothetical protein